MLRTLGALFRAMRPRQWPKNGFIFAALIFDRQLTNIPALLHTTAGFFLFCLLSSAVYLINDMADLEADRQHPTKRLRPLASGELAVGTARLATVVLLAISLSLSLVLDLQFFLLALIYLVINLGYSFWFKHMPIVDVLVLASLYVIRVAAGVVLVNVARFSPWLYVFTTFLALFLGVGKRRAELSQLAGGGNVTRKVLKGYTLELLDQYIMIVCTGTIITYSLYTFSAPNLPENHSMMLTIPFVIYGIFRYLYLVQVQGSGGAPEDVLLSDRPLQATLVLWGLSILWIFYAF